MRPLNIKISAFGPYAGHTEIALDKLGDRGLYLITGDTGAGKTTIFDAICYALYGEASGAYRDVSMLRSMYADPSTPTEVELTFLHAEKEYYIRRSPEFWRPKERGEGMTKRPADAELRMPDGSVITKVGDVTSAIEELLGINKNQFMQIMMLAQGDFLKLLVAETKERIGIFRDIFKTKYYQDLQFKLEECRKGIYCEVEDGRKSVRQFVDGILVDKDDVLSIDVDKAKAGEMTTDSVIELLDRLTDTDLAEKDKLDKSLEKIKGQLEEVNNRIGAAEVLNNAKKALEKAENELIEEKPKLEKLLLDLEEARIALKEKSKLDQEAGKIESEYEKYNEVDALEEVVDKSRIKLKKMTLELDELRKIVSNKSTELELVKNERETIKDSGEELQKLSVKQDRINTELEHLSELKEKLDGYFDELDLCERAKEEYKEVDERFNLLNSEYEAKEQAFMDAQAGILAEKLQEGVACPVCGSKDHPHPAKISDVVPSENELNEAKRVANAARSKREEVAGTVKGLNKSIETLANGIKKELNKLFKTETIEESADLISVCKEKNERELEEVDAKIQSTRKDKERKEKLDETIPKLEKEIGELMAKTVEQSTAKASLETEVEEKTAHLDQLKNGLSFKSRIEAENKNQELTKKSKELQDSFDKAQESVNKQKERIDELEGIVKTQKKTINESNVGNLEEDRALQEELNRKHKEVVTEGQSVGTRIKTNEDIRSNIIKKSSEISEKEKKLQWVTSLANTANGKLIGKDKIMLETYIQTMYFDRIINRANLRLLAMSGGQYELTRMKEASNARSQSGLELNVIDHSNGTERSVKTLSGGESFMASLSLALGLSDEVQSSAGGIQVDTMFVDEGFGSLDPDSLDMAYRALAALTESNRLVGIISHVADLKSRIDKQVVVTKAKSGGSSVELIV